MFSPFFKTISCFLSPKIKVVFPPFLEEIIVKYESDRKKYPDFHSFLPVIFEELDTLKPEDIDKLL